MSYKSLAKANRKNMTPEEKHLWYDFLRSCPVPFTRQRRIENYIELRITSLTSIAIKLDLSLRSTAVSTIQKPGNLMIRIGQPS